MQQTIKTILLLLKCLNVPWLPSPPVVLVVYTGRWLEEQPRKERRNILMILFQIIDHHSAQYLKIKIWAFEG